MAFNLAGRSYLKIADFSQREMLFLLDLARDLKRAKYARRKISVDQYAQFLLRFIEAFILKFET